MSFPRFRRHYECLVPSDERPQGVIDEKAVSNEQLIFIFTYLRCLLLC